MEYMAARCDEMSLEFPLGQMNEVGYLVVFLDKQFDILKHPKF